MFASGIGGVLCSTSYGIKKLLVAEQGTTYLCCHHFKFEPQVHGIDNSLYFQEYSKPEVLEKLKIALEQLPGDPEIQKAAAAFSYWLQATPWCVRPRPF